MGTVEWPFHILSGLVEEANFTSILRSCAILYLPLHILHLKSVSYPTCHGET